MTEHAFEPMRRAMVASQLRTTGVNDPRVVAAMGAVERERFVPQACLALAYADALVPLGNGRQLNSPMALGLLLTEAKLTGKERALLIGAATGYGAAVLALLVREVVALEEDEALAASAETALAQTGVTVVRGPLAKGWADGAPYDFILIDGSVGQLPQVIIDQVVEGGTIALALDDGGATRLGVGKVAAGAFGANLFTDAAAAALPGFEQPRGFSF
jgi:protein-L-isoaspartate(D-aspartate) O-methyltransferase